MKKVLIIGADGADWRYLNYGIKKGVLPNIKKMVDKGCSGNLKSLIPPVTFPVWMCFAEGKNPGKIGRFGFTEKIKGTYKTETKMTDVFNKINPFWEKLNKKGLSVGIVNIPYSYPPSKTNSFMLCIDEFDNVPKGTSCYPKEIEKEIISNLGELNYEANYSYFNEPLVKQMEHSVNFLKNRTKLNRFLIEKYGSKLSLFLTLYYPDRLQHFSIDPELHMEYYSVFDKKVKELVSLYNPDLTLIISDHGSGPVKKEFYVNEFLIKKGFLKLKRKRKFLSRIGFNLENIQKFFAFLKLDNFLIKLFPKYIVEGFIKKKIPLKKVGITDAEIDWSKTKACSFNDNGFIFINLKGREPEGSVEKKDYAKVAEEIISELKKLKDPETNKPLKLEIYKREEIYSGKYLEESPDIIYSIEDWDYVPKTGLPGEIFKSPRDPGNHKINGVFIASGKNVKPGKIENATLIDIAPTVLHFFGIKKPKDFDGKILSIFK